jgi:cation:H+ antiporter
VELALGNAVGSNIANIGLVLGAAVLFMGMRPERGAGIKELGAMSAVTVLACLLISNQYLSRVDAAVLLAALPVVAWLLVRNARSRDAGEPPGGSALTVRRSLPRNTAYAALGLLLLLGGAELLVRAAQRVAEIAGVGELVIGATIVAVGTSLPELAITIAGAIKREAELALGNVIGSNIFNLLVVIGVAGAIAPSGFSPQLLTLHIPMLLGFTLWFIALAALCRRRGHLGRAWSASLLLPFALYLGMVMALADVPA